MRWALAILVLTGCPKKATRHVYVPKSSAPCWRECNAIHVQCRGGRGRCEDKRLDCLLSCDGAYETEPIPAN